MAVTMSLRDPDLISVIKVCHAPPLPSRTSLGAKNKHPGSTTTTSRNKEEANREGPTKNNGNDIRNSWDVRKSNWVKFAEGKKMETENLLTTFQRSLTTCPG